MFLVQSLKGRGGKEGARSGRSSPKAPLSLRTASLTHPASKGEGGMADRLSLRPVFALPEPWNELISSIASYSVLDTAAGGGSGDQIVRAGAIDARRGLRERLPELEKLLDHRLPVMEEGKLVFRARREFLSPRVLQQLDREIAPPLRPVAAQAARVEDDYSSLLEGIDLDDLLGFGGESDGLAGFGLVPSSTTSAAIASSSGAAQSIDLPPNALSSSGSPDSRFSPLPPRGESPLCLLNRPRSSHRVGLAASKKPPAKDWLSELPLEPPPEGKEEEGSWLLRLLLSSPEHPNSDQRRPPLDGNPRSSKRQRLRVEGSPPAPGAPGPNSLPTENPFLGPFKQAMVSIREMFLIIESTDESATLLSALEEIEDRNSAPLSQSGVSLSKAEKLLGLASHLFSSSEPRAAGAALQLLLSQQATELSDEGRRSLLSKLLFRSGPKTSGWVRDLAWALLRAPFALFNKPASRHAMQAVEKAVGANADGVVESLLVPLLLPPLHDKEARGDLQSEHVLRIVRELLPPESCAFFALLFVQRSISVISSRTPENLPSGYHPWSPGTIAVLQQLLSKDISLERLAEAPSHFGQDPALRFPQSRNRFEYPLWRPPAGSRAWEELGLEPPELQSPEEEEGLGLGSVQALGLPPNALQGLLVLIRLNLAGGSLREFHGAGLDQPFPKPRISGPVELKLGLLVSGLVSRHGALFGRQPELLALLRQSVDAMRLGLARNKALQAIAKLEA